VRLRNHLRSHQHHQGMIAPTTRWQLSTPHTAAPLAVMRTTGG
jgi:hypothetical protein